MEEATNSRISIMPDFEGQYEDLTKCGVCGSQVRCPRTITTCHHNFCEECLEGIQYKKSSKTLFGKSLEGKCPTCKKEFHHSDVMENKLLKNIVEREQEMNRSSKMQFEKYRKEIVEMLTELERRIHTKEKCKMQLTREKQALKEMAEEVRTQLKMGKEKIADELEECYDSLMTKISVTEQTQLCQLERELVKQEQEHKNLVEFLKWSQGSVLEKLEVLNLNDILMGIERLRHLNHVGINEDGKFFSAVDIKLENTTSPEGEQPQQTSPNPPAPAKPNPSTTAAPQANQSKPGEKIQEIGKLQIMRGLPIEVGCIDNPRLLPEGTLKTMTGQFWKREVLWNFAKLQNTKLNVWENRYWLLDSPNKRIVSISLDGKNESQPHTLGNINCPRSFGKTIFGEVIVATADGLYNLNMELEVQSKIDSGNFNDISIAGNFLYAMESNAPNIRVYKRENNDWMLVVKSATTTGNVEEGATMVELDGSFYYSLPKAGKLVICRDGKTTEFGNNGNVQPGNLTQPRICAVDKDGFALVADTGNNRLQVVNPNGRWHVITLENMDQPWDVFVESSEIIHVYSGVHGVLRYSVPSLLDD